MEVTRTVTARLDLLHRVTDEELLRVSEGNPGYQFERAADGRLVVSPTGTQGGNHSGEVFGQLREWNGSAKGGVVFDSSTGFNMPDGACLSPDASWVRLERWQALTREQRKGFAPICPDAVFEVRSEWDSVADLRDKMRAYLANGAAIAVLVDPQRHAVEVYRPGADPERVEEPATVPLDPEIPGFSLDPQPLFED